MKKIIIPLALSVFFLCLYQSAIIAENTTKTNWPALIGYLFVTIAATCAAISKFFLYDSKSDFEQFNTICGMATAFLGMCLIGYDIFQNPESPFKVLDILIFLSIILSLISSLNVFVVATTVASALSILFLGLGVPEIGIGAFIIVVFYTGIFVRYRIKLSRNKLPGY